MLLSAITGYGAVLSQNDKPITPDLSIDSKQSKNLINWYNTLRASKGLQSIEHDSILDNICKILLMDECKIYRKSKNVYSEDSVRLLLRRNGIWDYQYEVTEISDIDTASIFKKFLLKDKQDYIHMGYYKTENRHILLKTKSYLKFVFGMGITRCDPVSSLNPTEKK
jgi:hypothetical protein